MPQKVRDREAQRFARAPSQHARRVLPSSLLSAEPL